MEKSGSHQVSIILISYNLGRMTRECVESIRRNVTIPCEIILVDNGSEDETVRILKELKGVRLICNEKNLGFPRACNQGIREAKGDILWLLNNDTVIPPGSLERMVELLLSDDRIGMVGPVTNSIRGRQRIDVDYERIEDMPAFAARQREQYAGQTWRMLNMVGFSMLLRREVFWEAGPLDERMKLGTFEDDDLCIRLVRRGYKLLVARDAFIHHYGNASFKAAGGYPESDGDNQAFASMAAGMTIPGEVTLDRELMSWLPEKMDRLLHVECGGGALGFWASEQGIHAEALESSPRKAELAGAAYERVQIYTGNEDFIYEGKNFDTVLLEKQGDTRAAVSVIRSVLPSLAPGCRLIWQVPMITGKREECFLTYLEEWTGEGCRPVWGGFCLSEFLKETEKMGFVLRKYECREKRRNFFNTSAYRRFQKTGHGEVTPAYAFFREMTGELEYEGCGVGRREAAHD